jgi:hypothetical protein
MDDILILIIGFSIVGIGLFLGFCYNLSRHFEG